MRLPAICLLVLTLVPLALNAGDPPLIITSISPASGSEDGGTIVTIRGSGFHYCIICSPPSPPPEVYFGEVAAQWVQTLDETTLQAMTPPHLPSTVNVFVVYDTYGAELPASFSFIGDGVSPEFERLLLPIFLPPVHGAYGSEFHTRLTGTKSGETEFVDIHGIEPACPIPEGCAGEPFRVDGAFDSIWAVRNISGRPGRFIYVSRSQLDALSLHLRVYDTSRSQLNFGTELPVVRSDRFRNDRIVLTGVPADPRFRKMLRIYSTETLTLNVTIGTEVRQVTLAPGNGIYDPAYAEIGDFPSEPEPMQIVVERAPCPNISGPCLPPPDTGFWAIVSVTNNETQMITTITPQP